MNNTNYCIALLLLIVRVLGQTGSAGQWNVSTISSRPQAQSLSSLDPDPYRDFSFLIPYNQSQTCDIYGPLCQTGSITVEVSLSNSQSTTTTLPCSSYLTAQASYLNIPQEGFPDGDFPYFPSEWLTGFGRSPECRSYASVWSNTGVYTFTGCGTNDATVSQQTSDLMSTLSEIPPGFLRHEEVATPWTCCGNCSFEVQEVRLYYFPDENASAYCHSKGIPMIGNNVSSVIGSSTINASVNRIGKRASTDSLAFLSGQTFTSPSLYLEIVGTAAISDQCGPVGATLTNPWVAVPSGQLATYSEGLQSLGQCYDDIQGFGWGFEGTTKTLNVADLECPTFGLGPGTSSNGKPCRTIGPPYLPLIVPPSQVLSLDPGWLQFCTGLLSYAVGLSSFALYDPPIALQPVSGLLAPEPGPRPADPVITQDPPSDPAATSLVQPARVPSVNLPSPTTSDNQDPSVPDISQSALSVVNSLKPNTPAQTTVGNGLPLVDVPGAPNVPKASLQATTQGLGGLIMGGFGSGPSNGEVSPIVDQSYAAGTALTITVGDQTFAPSKDGFVVAGTSVVPGSAPVMIAGTPVSLSPSGGLFVGGSKIDVPQEDPGKSPPVTLAAGGEQFVAAKTGFFIKGFQVLPGGAPVSISGTPISLGTSGNLVIGTSTIALSGSNSAINTFNVGGDTFTASPVGFTVAGSQVLPGGSAIVVSGTTISLSPSGVLDIGGASINLAPQVPSVDVISVGGQTVTANPSGFQIDGSSILPGGTPVTISGTQVSLDQSGELHVGTSSIGLVPFKTVIPGIFTVDGLTFTAGSSAVAVDGVTLTPGGAAATIGGDRISLGLNGSLVVGSSTVAVPSTALGGISTAQFFEGGQSRVTASTHLGCIIALTSGFTLFLYT
ncbi:hypothetical protein BDR22DRAFT_974426 [Usnea florida]